MIRLIKRKFMEKDRKYTQMSIWFGNKLNIEQDGCIRGRITIDNNFTWKFIRSINTEDKVTTWFDIAWLWFQFVYAKR